MVAYQKWSGQTYIHTYIPMSNKLQVIAIANSASTTIAI
jgi:hypothetical protein